VERLKKGVENVGRLADEYEKSNIVDIINDKEDNYVKVENVAEFMGGLSYNSEDEFQQDGRERTEVIGIPAVERGAIDWNKTVYVENVKNSRYNSRRLQKGDILMIMSNGSESRLGKCAIIDKHLDATYGAFLSRIRPKEEINPQVLFQILNSPLVHDELIEISKGSTSLGNLSQKDVKGVEIPDPSEVGEEGLENITSTNSHLSDINPKIETVSELMSNYRNSVLAHAFKSEIDY
jgi:type I restriction enzyme S subunit